MSIMTIEMRPATPADVPELVSILQEAANFKASQGDEIWGPIPFTAAEVAGTVALGNTYIASVEGQAAGSVDLAWNDARMWGPDKGNDNQAVYIHRAAVRDGFRRQRVGELIVAWASAQVLSAGRSFLRLDCSYENPKLCAYYESLGFKEAGRKEFQDPRYTAAFYQKSV